MRRSILLAVVSFLALASTAKGETPDEQWKRCRHGEPDATIAACTARIDGDREMAANRALAARGTA